MAPGNRNNTYGFNIVTPFWTERLIVNYTLVVGPNEDCIYYTKTTLFKVIFEKNDTFWDKLKRVEFIEKYNCDPDKLQEKYSG